MKLDFEKLFEKALSETIDNNGGSLYDALYEFGIDYDSEEGQAIKEWFGWEEEPEDYEDEEEDNEEEIKRLKYLLNKEGCCSLDKDEMYELQELLDKYGYPQY